LDSREEEINERKYYFVIFGQ
jgi:hypothetical protein